MMKIFLVLVFGYFICLSCNGQSCQNLPTIFTSYQSATNTVKSTTFEVEDNFYDDSWITKVSYYSCDGNKGYMIMKTDRGKEYIFKNVEIEVWEAFKNADNKGRYYHTNLKGESRYFLNIN